MTQPAPMNALSALRHWSKVTPDATAIRSPAGSVSYRRLAELVDAAAGVFAEARCRRCAILVENGAPWIVADLTLRQVGCIAVPLPGYFTNAQIGHALKRSGADHILTDDPARFAHFAPIGGIEPGICNPGLLRIVRPDGEPRPSLPEGSRKITFTSGTTGQPKGICLTDEAIDAVACSLLEATRANAGDHHLSILPYAALLENIAGIDVPLLAGATTCALPTSELGFSGSSGLQATTLAGNLDLYRPSSIVTVPQILLALIEVARKSGWRPHYLRHVAVGGATLPAGAIALARSLGIPAFEGYGLSECTSVVTLNTNDADRPGSVGRPLPHLRVSLAPDGEVLVAGAGAAGILADGGSIVFPPGEPVPTGDTGRFDDAGYLHLTGRKRDIFITAYGRNVAPEWVECELTATASIVQAFVCGEARPWNIAVIVPRPDVLTANPENWHELVGADIAKVNDSLPDYARVQRWLPAREPFHPGNGLLTWNGRLRRAQLAATYAEGIGHLYDKEPAYVH